MHAIIQPLLAAELDISVVVSKSHPAEMTNSPLGQRLPSRAQVLPPGMKFRRHSNRSEIEPPLQELDNTLRLEEQRDVVHRRYVVYAKHLVLRDMAEVGHFALCRLIERLVALDPAGNLHDSSVQSTVISIKPLRALPNRVEVQDRASHGRWIA